MLNSAPNPILFICANYSSNVRQPNLHTQQLLKLTRQERNLLQQVLNPNHQHKKTKRSASVLDVCFGLTFPSRPVFTGFSLPRLKRKTSGLNCPELKLSGFNKTLSKSLSLFPGRGRCNGWGQWVEWEH